MTQRMRDWLLLYIVAVFVNGLIAILVSRPGYMDAYYYFNGARFIAEGQGLVEPYLWNYVGAPPALPTPAFAYWQPFPSILAAAGILLFGRTSAFGSAQAMYVLAIAFLPIVSYQVASQAGGRRYGVLAGLLTVFSGYYVVRWSLPESFTPFALAGAGALALASLGLEGRGWWMWMLSGVCAGLAHLTRADGILLVLVVGVTSLYYAFQGSLITDEKSQVSLTSRVVPLLSIGAGYLIIMVPWFCRNLAAFGSLQAPGGLSALWLNDYNDLYTYPPNLTAQRFFDAGWPTIIEVKRKAFLLNLGNFIGTQNLVFLTPLTLIGVGRRWREPWLLPSLIYGVALFGAMTFAFSLVGVRGGYFHSGGALLPFVFTAAVLGLDDVLRWLARHRRWRLEQARRVFSAFLILLAVFVTGYLVMVQIVGWPPAGEVAWNTSDAVYDEIGATLDALDVPVSTRVMVNDPPGFYYYTGHGGAPLPNGDEDMLLSAIHDYEIGFVVVDQHVVDELHSLYLNGPATSHLVLVETYGSESYPVYLYQVIP